MNEAVHIGLSPVDTLMFRDGRPFNQGDVGGAEAVSVFPPFPSTSTGTVRWILSRVLGFDGRPSTWPKAMLGDGVNWQDGRTTLGPLSFSPAYLTRDDETLYPLPRHLVSAVNDQSTVYRRLVPEVAVAGLATDLDTPNAAAGLPRLVVPVDGEVLQPEGMWVDADTLGHVLSGSEPDDDKVISQDEMWQLETRVGIGIDNWDQSNLASRRVIDGALYAASHIRFHANISLKVSVASQTSTLPDIPASGSLFPMGGEHRMVGVKSVSRPKWPDPPRAFSKTDQGLRYCVYHVSACCLRSLPRGGEALENLPGRVVSACLGKALAIGGFDSVNRSPIPMRPAVPAGSIWFLEAEGRAVETTLQQLHGRSIGEATDWGFGQIFIGTW
jgi:CRISPR-associated protein Cmr3